MSSIEDHNLRLLVRTSFSNRAGYVVRAEDQVFRKVQSELHFATDEIQIPTTADVLRIKLMLEPRVDYDRKALLEELLRP